MHRILSSSKVHRPSSELGSQIAALLTDAWHSSPSPLRISPKVLEQVAPILLSKGSAGLGWWRIRSSDLRTSAAGCRLRDAYRLHSARNALRERQLVQAFGYLRSAGVEPLLAKGWAVGRLYPERGLRPYGDLDLSVGPDLYSTARAALRSPDAPECPIELHNGFRELTDRSAQELFQRSRLVSLDDLEIRVLGCEDHLRLLCLHALHHGVWRPLWLVDVAVMLERLPDEFNWELCMSGDRWGADGVRSVLALAHELLGASLDKVPAGHRSRRVPGWLIPAALLEWGRKDHYMTGRGMEEYLWQPKGVIQALYWRWPNPIRATFATRAPFNELPRLPFQLAECLLRIIRFACRLARIFRRN